MGFLSDKPYTAITANIDRLCGKDYDEDDVSELPDLLEIISLRPDGPTEAARAIRKKLKYGNNHEQLRALTLLDAFVENGGRKMGPLYRDEYLLERLRLLVSGQVVDGRVKKKMQGLCIGWHNELHDKPGYEQLALLYKQVPQRQKRERPTPNYLRNDDFSDGEEDDEEEADQGASSSSARVRGNHSGSGSFSHSRNNSRDIAKERAERDEREQAAASEKRADKERRRQAKEQRKQQQREQREQPHINMMIERPKIKQALADASSTTTNLQNSLQLINREVELATENKRATDCFNKCRKLRRQILRYIHTIEGDEELLGPLIHANEELVEALKAYDAMSREDSDSEDWRSENDTNDLSKRVKNLKVRRNYDDDEEEDSDLSESQEEEEVRPARVAAIIKKKPPPPISPKPIGLRSPRHTVREDEDEDDPFADSNRAKSKPNVKPMW